MRNKAVKITAFYNVIMKYLLALSIIGNMFTPFNTPVRNYGGTMSEFSYNYVYIVDYYESTQVASSGVYQFEHDYPTYYGIKVNIVFKQPIKSARLQLTLSSSNTNSAYWESIGENCYITRSTTTKYYVDCYNCSNATFIMLMSYQDVKDEYGYNRLSFNSVLESVNTWIEYGSQYCDVRGLQVSSNYVIDTEPDYTTQLNTLLSQTDSVENYLLQIWNNAITMNTTLSNISSTLSSISSYIQAINNKLDNINNIKWNTINTSYKGWTTDYNTFDTNYEYHDPGWYVIENPDFSSNTAIGIYKLTLPLGVGGTTINDIRFAQYWSNAWREFSLNSYLYYPTRNYIVIYFTVSESYHQWPQGSYPLGIYVNKRMYRYSAYNFTLEYILQSDDHYWDLYNIMQNKKNSENIQNSLNDIISILGDINLSQNDITEYHEVDQYVDNLVENIVFPEIPQAPDGYLERLQIILDPVKDIFASSDLTYFRWIYSILAIFTIYKLVVK